MSYVYIAPLADKSAFKVGKANAPSSRLSQLLHYYDFETTKIVIFNCGNEGNAFSLETILHKSCERKRVLLPFEGGTEFFSYEALEGAVRIANIVSEINGFRTVKFVQVMQDAVDETGLIIQAFASKIRARRLELNLTQAELAERSGLGKRTIERAETGGKATFQNMVAVLRELNLEYLFSGLEVEEPIRKRAQPRLN
jgi:DNA-binding XRE family transcriptional regulator